MKSISTINPAVTENTKYLIIKAHALFMGVWLDHGSSQHFVSFLTLRTCWATFKQRIT